jgi:hypothetical protein
MWMREVNHVKRFMLAFCSNYVLKLPSPLSRHLMRYATTFRSATTPLAIVSEKICSHNMNQKLLYLRYRSRNMCCWLTKYMVGKCLFKWSIVDCERRSGGSESGCIPHEVTGKWRGKL